MKSVSQDPKVQVQVKEELKKRQLANFLVFLRCDHKLTQKELARRMKCTQSKISKLEMSYDDQISVKDLLEYGKALHLQLELGYRNKDVKITELINYHVCRIRNYLSKLIFLSKGDNAMMGGVLKVIGSTLDKFLDIVDDHLKIIKKIDNRSIREPKDEIHISVPLKEKKELTKI
ncbi:MAG: XRE family transcriptional regulator [Candidatus Omnitrophica bacterium]|nr:XRE family transcriptional regulator [Candidatus Omnitrophota bacterium]